MSDSEEFWSAEEDDSTSNKSKLKQKCAVGNNVSTQPTKIQSSIQKSEYPEPPVPELLEENVISNDIQKDVDRKAEIEDKTSETEDSIVNKGKEHDEVTIPELGPEELERIKSDVLERKEAGNNLFRLGEFAPAMEEYSSGIEICPTQLRTEKSVLLSNRSLCRLKLGEEQLALADCSDALGLDPGYVKVRLRRAQLCEELGKLEEALEDYSHVLKSDADNRQARDAVPRLTVEVEKQREVLKQEAISKLKDLGNMILNPFGMSTNDFNFVQDPNTGGYNLSFEKKS